jgi:hypothetical protein
LANKRKDTRGKKQEEGSKKQETRGRKQEAGGMEKEEGERGGGNGSAPEAAGPLAREGKGWGINLFFDPGGAYRRIY